MMRPTYPVTEDFVSQTFYKHQSVTVLPCYHKPTNCSYRNLFGNVLCTIIRFIVILFSHLGLGPPKDIFHPGNPTCMLCAFLTYNVRVTCPSLVLHNLTTQIILIKASNYAVSTSRNFPPSFQKSPH